MAQFKGPNCIYNKNNAYCTNKNIKKSLFGLGMRCCFLYANCGGYCDYQEQKFRPAPSIANRIVPVESISNPKSIDVVKTLCTILQEELNKETEISQIKEEIDSNKKLLIPLYQEIRDNTKEKEEALASLQSAGILDENGEFTEPYKHLGRAINK